jgi:serine/threonine-protein kinase
LLTAESPQKFYGKIPRGYGFKLENIPTIAPKLREVILRTTAAKPGDRFQTAQQLARALAACL